MVPPLSVLSMSRCLHNALVPPRLHKEPIFERAINMHSRGSIEQCFAFWSLCMGVSKKNASDPPHWRGPREQ